MAIQEVFGGLGEFVLAQEAESRTESGDKFLQLRVRVFLAGQSFLAPLRSAIFNDRGIAAAPGGVGEYFHGWGWMKIALQLC